MAVSAAPYRLIVVISGGQTGADRAALDVAIKLGLQHGGWCPAGRRAEDGAIEAQYQLRETESSRYRQRTRRNVLDSDGTLVLNLGRLDGGTLETVRIAERAGRQHLVVQLDDDARPADRVDQVARWIERAGVERLNVAGPRESKRRGIYLAARVFLVELLGPAKA
jgi:hypothetical protein